MSIHKEISFETEICEYLPRNHRAQTGETLLARLRDPFDPRGTLDRLQQRRSALISAAVTGHIDVRTH